MYQLPCSARLPDGHAPSLPPQLPGLNENSDGTLRQDLETLYSLAMSAVVLNFTYPYWFFSESQNRDNEPTDPGESPKLP